jgi:hypothetical protein
MSGHGFSRLIPPIPGSSQFSNRMALLISALCREGGEKQMRKPHLLHGSNSLLLWLKWVHVFEQGLRTV